MAEPLALSLSRHGCQSAYPGECKYITLSPIPYATLTLKLLQGVGFPLLEMQSFSSVTRNITHQVLMIPAVFRLEETCPEVPLK